MRKFETVELPREPGGEMNHAPIRDADLAYTPKHERARFTSMTCKEVYRKGTTTKMDDGLAILTRILVGYVEGLGNRIDEELTLPYQQLNESECAVTPMKVFSAFREWLETPLFISSTPPAGAGDGGDVRIATCLREPGIAAWFFPVDEEALLGLAQANGNGGEK